MSIKNQTEEKALRKKSTMKPDQSTTGQQAAITMKFTDAELETLSSGILSLIEGTVRAKALIPNKKVHTAIDEYCTGLQTLNTKICCIQQS